jgi:hypothetical protein
MNLPGNAAKLSGISGEQKKRLFSSFHPEPKTREITW